MTNGMRLENSPSPTFDFISTGAGSCLNEPHRSFVVYDLRGFPKKNPEKKFLTMCRHLCYTPYYVQSGI